MFVRWSSQVIERDDAGRLPGLGDTVVRRFDAPEALDMRFHEVRTKSALNRVPAASRLPFNWTVNPYRGCSHACVYCLSGETQILLADGRTRALADLRQGDRIYGTRKGRYVRTEVLAHWSTRKAAYRVTLDDGTEIVSSGDHRLLSRRGWRYVGSTMAVGDRLAGVGRFAEAPEEDVDYRRGYLCGAVHGDDHLFRLTPAGREALERVDLYLAELGLAMSAAAVAGYREVRVTRPPSESMRHVLAWPWEASAQWCKGFLAGVFDADGSGGAALRLVNSDPAVLRRAADSLRTLGFHFVSEDAQSLRVLGGSAEQLRFFHTVNPAIRRKCTIDGRAVKYPASMRVTSIEPLGFEMPMFDITTGTGDFIANGVVSHNCFARPTHEYLELDAGRDFEREIVVKVNVPEVLRAELRKPSWAGETVALGTNTDPYQWVEGRYKLMRGIWEALRDYRNPCSILTKSPLLLRDLDLMKEIAAVTHISACLSVPTLDEKAWRATEPHTPHPRARLEAVAELNRNGIPTGILMAPLIPGINDAPEQVEKIVELATEAGATYIGGQTLFLSTAVRRIFMDWLRDYRPDLVPRYERLYAKGSRLSPAERHKIESAAGAPWLKPRPDMDPYRRHRGGIHRAPPPLLPMPVQRVKQETLF